MNDFIFSFKHVEFSINFISAAAHVFALGGAKWRNVRKKISPTFTSRKFKEMFQTLVESSSLLEQTLRQLECRGQPVDIKHILGKLTF